jgi:hypothetical protein
MRNFWIILLVIVLIILGVWFWGGNNDALEPNGDDNDALSEEAERQMASAAARQALAARLSAAPELLTDVVEVDSERVEWPNACLGLPEEDEMCAEVITPGWRVAFTVGDEEYVYRTNMNGSEVRLEAGPENE